MSPSRVILVTSLCLLLLKESCLSLSLRDVSDEVGSGDSVDSYVEEGTVPFGLCTVMVTESLCSPVLGSRVAVLYPERSQITGNSSLTDIEVLHVYERAITDKRQYYQDNGVQVESEGCWESVLVSVCLELYPVCSASRARSSCSLPCDKWKLHVGSTCTCSEVEACQSLLQQVAGACPLSQGQTLYTNNGVQCQQLSSDLHQKIDSGTPSLESLSCQTLQQDAFCYPVLQTVQVATTSSHSLQGEVALDRFHQLTQISDRSFVDLTSNECSSAMQLAACMSVYSPCVCSGGSNFSKVDYCSDVDFSLIVDKVLDVCQCNSLTQNCRLQLLLKLDGVEDAVTVVSPQDEGQYCQRLPEDILSQYMGLTTEVNSTTVTLLYTTATLCPTSTTTPTPTSSRSSVTQSLSPSPVDVQTHTLLLPTPSNSPSSSPSGGSSLGGPTTPCPPFEDDAAVSLFSATSTLCLVLAILVAALLH